MKNILICGDSFASDWTKKYNGVGWPNLLSQKYNVTNLAQAGCSEYKIHNQLSSINLSKFNYIIISHTSPFRIYVRNHPIHYNDVLHKNSDLIYSDIKEHSKNNPDLLPIVKYYEDYFDFDYAIFTHNLICEKIDLLTQKYNTIHITSFDWKKLYKFNNMIFFETIFKNHKGLINHYNDLGNRIVFEEILTRIGL